MLEELTILNCKVGKWRSLIPPDTRTKQVGEVECYAGFSLYLSFPLDGNPEVTEKLALHPAFVSVQPDPKFLTAAQRKIPPHGRICACLSSSVSEPEFEQSSPYCVRIQVLEKQIVVIAFLFGDMSVLLQKKKYIPVSWSPSPTKAIKPESSFLRVGGTERPKSEREACDEIRKLYKEV